VLSRVLLKMANVDLDKLDSVYSRRDTKVCFTLWITYALREQKNRALKEKLKSLREDLGAVGASLAPNDDDECDGEVTITSMVDELHVSPPALLGVHVGPPQSEQPVVNNSDEGEELGVQLEVAALSGSVDLVEARAEIAELKHQQQECERVVDQALAHCKRLGGELQDRNKEIANLRNQLAQQQAMNGLTAAATTE